MDVSSTPSIIHVRHFPIPPIRQSSHQPSHPSQQALRFLRTSRWQPALDVEGRSALARQSFIFFFLFFFVVIFLSFFLSFFLGSSFDVGVFLFGHLGWKLQFHPRKDIFLFRLFLLSRCENNRRDGRLTPLLLFFFRSTNIHETQAGSLVVFTPLVNHPLFCF